MIIDLLKTKFDGQAVAAGQAMMTTRAAQGKHNPTHRVPPFQERPGRRPSMHQPVTVQRQTRNW